MEENTKTKLDFYLKMYQEQSVQMRHYETQRSNIVTAIFAISGALIGIISHNGIECEDLYLVIFLIFIGVFGIGFLYRHSKRLKKEKSTVKEYKQKLFNLLKSEETTNEFEDDRFINTDLISMRHWWIGMSVAIVLIGSILLFQIIKLAYQQCC
jgi:RsiW-degrading membrane proteinase PrsW (M82 family)